MRIICVGSYGGHFIQLLKIANFLDQYHEISLLSTKPVENSLDYTLDDFNIKNVHKGRKNFFRIVKLILREKPDMILTTGAAPGLQVAFIAMLMGKKTIWIDSVANSQTLSISGLLASKFCTMTFSQWEDVAQKYKKVEYIGSLL